MNTKAVSFIIFLLIFQVGCIKESSVKEFNFTTILKSKIVSVNKSNGRFKISLCNELPFSWDEIIILPPYTKFNPSEKKTLKNYREIEKMQPELTLDENKCVLLFIDDNDIKRYCFVSRSLLDFNQVNQIKGKTRFTNKITKEEACNKFYLEKNGENNFLLILE